VLVRLCAFCVPIFVALALAEVWTVKAVRSSYSIKRQSLEALAGQVDVLVIGSSRAYVGIAAKHLSGVAFNLAGTSQSVDYDYRLLNRVLPELPKLKRVIIEVQDLSLFYQLHEGSEAWRQYFYEQEWGISPLELKDWLDVRMFSRVALRTFGFYRSALLAAIRSYARGTPFVPDSSIHDIDERGWWALSEVKADLSPAAAAGALARHVSLMKRSYEAANLAYLTGMLSALRQRNIDVVLVTLPVSTSYSRGMNEEYWSRTQEAMKRITTEFGVRYFCFLTVPEFGAEEFYDTDHLSARGAVRFTEVLRSELERP